MFSNNALVLFTLSSILVMSNGLLLQCSFSLKVQTELGELYTCSARILPILDEYCVNEMTSNSVHLPGYGNEDVEALIYTETIGFIPCNISSYFPNLKFLVGSKINTSSLTREDLEGFPSLRTLRFADNNLREIGNDLFYNNPLLTSIYLENNPIRHVAHNVFDHLSELHTLYMYQTKCTSKFAAGNRRGVEILLFDIILECPPTFQMTEERIVNGSLLNQFVRSQIDSATDPLKTRLTTIEEQLNLLAERVEFLEGSETLSVNRRIGN